MKQENVKSFKNRKADHDYFYIDTLEAGIVLMGSEIKSIRAGSIHFKDSHVRFEGGEAWLYNLHISEYSASSYFGHTPERKRKLLLNRHEIRKWDARVREKGLTVVPREIYIDKNGRAKVLIAIARGKHSFDKRDAMQNEAMRRDAQRRMKEGE
jgi:SsrA-binding protein